jgi:hypothetical protein
MVADIVLALVIFYWVLPFLVDLAITLFVLAAYGVFLFAQAFSGKPVKP